MSYSQAKFAPPRQQQQWRATITKKLTKIVAALPQKFKRTALASWRPAPAGRASRPTTTVQATHSSQAFHAPGSEKGRRHRHARVARPDYTPRGNRTRDRWAPIVRKQSAERRSRGRSGSRTLRALTDTSVQ